MEWRRGPGIGTVEPGSIPGTRRVAALASLAGVRNVTATGLRARGICGNRVRVQKWTLIWIWTIFRGIRVDP